MSVRGTNPSAAPSAISISGAKLQVLDPILVQRLSDGLMKALLAKNHGNRCSDYVLI